MVNRTTKVAQGEVDVRCMLDRIKAVDRDVRFSFITGNFKPLDAGIPVAGK